jgi:DNA-binding transcriptional regulator YdaS (Cro superfamily)
MSLYIVPPDGGKGGAAPKPRGRRRASICLTPSESAALAAGLKALNAQYTWKKLAELVGVCVETLRFVGSGRKPGSPGLALRVARALNISVDRLLRPGPAQIATCRHCGGVLEGK